MITRRTKFQLKKALQREHILEGTIFAVGDIDEVIRLIRSSKTRDEAIEKLMVQGFRISTSGDKGAEVLSQAARPHQAEASGDFRARTRAWRCRRTA